MKRVLKIVLSSLLLAYIPCLFLFPLFINQTAWWQTPYWWNLLICFLISFPFYLAFIEICFIVVCLLDKKEQQKGEKILNILTAIVSLCILLATIKFFDLLLVVWALSAVLIILWVIGGILFKRKKAVKSPDKPREKT